eukprot:CAMPEP_0198516952 /NCGR_PEP_ID=MMETSP1462-20131121/18223_1 /TAXON_ID=1333877 /ORGANISM="Brandtodinium nutriculum, Strain RCC3387" /LENGTH=145 /DNA_ID=CAMNT_0044246495 /DNA_START=25 /DNA_END=460 /DNA_ORIENTATION=-
MKRHPTLQSSAAQGAEEAHHDGVGRHGQHHAEVRLCGLREDAGLVCVDVQHLGAPDVQRRRDGARERGRERQGRRYGRWDAARVLAADKVAHARGGGDLGGHEGHIADGKRVEQQTVGAHGQLAAREPPGEDGLDLGGPPLRPQG